MEDTLRDLQQVMAAHRRALAETRLLPIEAMIPASIPAAIPVAPDPTEARSRLMQRLGRDIERVSGIEISGMIEAKLARVLSSVDLAELAAWTDRLQQLPPSDPEWLSLIESLTVHETFFHRDRAQLDHLAELLRAIVMDAAADRRCCVRVWSAGCATGEEAYTLAILALLALREAGFAEEDADGGIVPRPPWQIDVLGTDISRLVLAQANAAVYSTEGLSPFRELPVELRRFFPLLPRGEFGESECRGVLPSLRQHVRFRQFNLLSAAPPETGFDVVLCRNVMIYLTPSARFEVQAPLTEALRPGGYLLLGPTDAVADPAAYEACWGAGAVAYALKRLQ